MSSDKLVFDLSQEIEGSPQIFVRKDWINILDNMNQNYSANQVILDTSQLSNSNKYMAYRESYLSVPINLCLTCSVDRTQSVGFNGSVATESVAIAATAGTAAQTVIIPRACDYVMGLKNWFGTLFHSLTLDMNGTTIIQQTPLINLVNMFKLQTSLSWGDVQTQGKTIGFYPDTAQAVESMIVVAGTANARSTSGLGTSCNTLYPLTEMGDLSYVVNPVLGNTVAAPLLFSAVSQAPIGSGCNTKFANFSSGLGNKGLLKRIQGFAIDPEGVIGSFGAGSSFSSQKNTTASSTISQFLDASKLQQLYKGFIFNKGDGILQTATVATVYLKHLHSFFAMCPLLKGTFFKLTCFLNNSTTTFTIADKTTDVTSVANFYANTLGNYSALTSSVPVGGVNPLMLTDTSNLFGGASALGNGNYTASVNVGATVLTSQRGSAALTVPAVSQLSKSIYLYIPSYTFNPIFEQAYLSSPIKSIKYSDYYQYQVINVASSGQFNNLISNGISNLKSILILPFFASSDANGAQATGLPAGMPCYQSPFDTAGAGSTSPLCQFSNFNVVVSGQNAIYNTERYSFEQFNNQFKGCNAVNGDLTDGLTSGLFDEESWFLNQSYYYVNISRMLPVEEQVPKSVQIIGTNMSLRNIDLICFLEYGCSVQLDVLSGARV